MYRLLYFVGVFVALAIISNLQSTGADHIRNSEDESSINYIVNLRNKSQSEKNKRYFPGFKFYTRKIRTYFHRRDANGDGVFSKEEYKMGADRFDQMKNGSRENKAAMRQKIFQLYHDYAKFAGEDEKITEEVVMEAFLTQRNMLLSEDALPAIIKGLIEHGFQMLDTNHDLQLTLSEYTRLFYNLGVKHYKDIAKYSFASIDRNHDGRVTYDEYVEAFREFYFRADERAPGNMLLGPII